MCRNFEQNNSYRVLYFYPWDPRISVIFFNRTNETKCIGTTRIFSTSDPEI